MLDRNFTLNTELYQNHLNTWCKVWADHANFFLGMIPNWDEFEAILTEYYYQDMLGRNRIYDC